MCSFTLLTRAGVLGQDWSQSGRHLDGASMEKTLFAKRLLLLLADYRQDLDGLR